MPGDHAWTAATSSRIGRRPLPVPAGVTVSVEGGQVRVAKGSTTSVMRLPDGIAVRVDGQGVHVAPRPAAAPMVKPAPKAVRRYKSPEFKRPFSTASSRAMGMEAAEVFPKRSTLT